MNTSHFNIPKEEFTQLPAILILEQDQPNDTQNIKEHFQKHKEKIQQTIQNFYTYTRDLSTHHFVEFEKNHSFIKSLLCAFESLSSSQEMDQNNITKEIIKYNEQMQEILYFEQQPDFLQFQKVIADMKAYRQKLNLSIHLFDTSEWEEVLQVLKLVDDIEKKLSDVIKYNGYRKSEYEDTLRKAPKKVQNTLKTTPSPYTEKKKSVLTKLLWVLKI